MAKSFNPLNRENSNQIVARFQLMKNISEVSIP